MTEAGTPDANSELDGAISSLQDELTAIGQIGAALDALDTNARQRAINFVLSRYGLAVTGTGHKVDKPNRIQGVTAAERKVPEGGKGAPSEFEDIGALYDRAGPTTDPERALVAAYWFQVIEGQQDFGSQQLNNALKNLGHGIENVTKALERLKARKPSLIRQTQKSGSSKQARKTYKVTDAGIKAVSAMLAGAPEHEE